jgi:hypothetical protein
MLKAYILQIAMVGIIVAALPLHSAFGAADSNKAEPSVESRDEFMAQINGKELRLWKGLKLSEVFETLGDPEDIGVIYSKTKIYGWGLDCVTGQSVIIEARAPKNEVIDWMIMRFNEGKIVQIFAYSVPGESRSQSANIANMIKYMRESRKLGKPLCPCGLWCQVINLTEYQDQEQQFEILEKYDVVVPLLIVGLRNEGLTPVKTSDNLADDVFLTIKTPDGKEHISRLSKIDKPNPKIFNTGDNFGVHIPFFSWVIDSNKPVDVPVGTYQYYATFLGARSYTKIVEVHRQAFVVASPNSTDEEIVIKPYYNKLPIHELKYDELVKNCKAAFEKKFVGDPNKVLISAYLREKAPMLIPGGGTGIGVYNNPATFFLSDFAEVKIRKKIK